MGSEVFLGYDLVKNCFLKLVVFNLEPEIVLAFGWQTFQKFVHLIQDLFSELTQIIFPVFIQLQYQFGQSLALRSQIELGFLVEVNEDTPDPLALLPVNLLGADHALNAEHESHPDINWSWLSHWIQGGNQFWKAELLYGCGDAPFDLVLHELGGRYWFFYDGQDYVLGEGVHFFVQATHHLVQTHQG